MVLCTLNIVFGLGLVAAVRSQKVEGSIASILEDTNIREIMSETHESMKRLNERVKNRPEVEEVEFHGDNSRIVITPTKIYSIDDMPAELRNDINKNLEEASKYILSLGRNYGQLFNRSEMERLSRGLLDRRLKPKRRRKRCDGPCEKIAVDVYFEGLCPDSKDFIKYQLAPVFPQFADYINLTLVPFGKAHSTETGFECQHGKRECETNLLMSCVLSMIPRGQPQVTFTDCYMTHPLGYGQLKQCSDQVGVALENVQACAASSYGRQLQLEAEKATKTSTPGPDFVPTVVINKSFNQHEQNEIVGGKLAAVLCLYLPNAEPCIRPTLL